MFIKMENIFQLDFSKIFTIQNAIIYIIVINIIAFVTMYWDKRRAIKGKWRVKENTLLFLVILGGGIGAIVGMYTFRHKTKKMAFVIGFPLILICQILLIILFFVI